VNKILHVYKYYVYKQMPSRLFQVRTLALAAVVAGFSGLVGASLLLFSLFPLNVLNVGPTSNPYHTVDMPVYLLYVEGGLYALLGFTASVVAASTISGNAKGAKSSALGLAAILCIAWVGHGATAAWRAFQLYSSIDGSCGDISTAAACPATRVGRAIENDVDCVFWFWGDMQSRADLVAAYPNEQISMLDLMDWARHAPYGWYHKGGDVVYGGQELFTYQDTFEQTYNISVGAFKITQNTVPDIAHCWYWGCHDVCNEERYFINHAMVWFAAAWAAVEIILFAVGIYLGRAPVVEEKKSLEAAAARLAQPPTQKVVLGRRLRW